MWRTSDAVRIVAISVLAVSVFGGMALAQNKAAPSIEIRTTARPVEPVTVCEASANLKRFSGKLIAVVGRLDRDASLVDSTSYLAQDKCERPVTLEGKEWPNKILVWGEWEKGMPRPPRDNLEIDYAAVVQKILGISKNTQLGFHKEPAFKTEGRTIVLSQMRDVKDNWGAAYGRLVGVSKEKKFGCSDADGCEGFDGAVAVLIINPASLRTYDDDNVRSQGAKP